MHVLPIRKVERLDMYLAFWLENGSDACKISTAILWGFFQLWAAVNQMI